MIAEVRRKAIHLAFILVPLIYLYDLLPKAFIVRGLLVATAVSIAIAWYLIQGGDDFTDRNTSPEPLDVAFGIALIVLVLEAMRRTNGWIMPVITSCFIAYALLTAMLFIRGQWSFGRASGAMLAGVLPFGTFVFDARLQRERQAVP